MADEHATESPLPQIVAGSIDKLLARGSERGYVTHDELSATLPLDQLSSEEIEDTMTMLSELGIMVTESDGQAVTSIMTIPGVLTTLFGCICGR